jgi:hypothetical protein
VRPWSRSSCHSPWTCPSWARNGASSARGSMTTRSLPPFPSRTHAGAVEQTRQQPGDAVARACEQRLHFDVREDDRDPPMRHRAAECLQPWHVDAEHLAVEKEQRAERLSVRRGGDAALVGEHGQKRLHSGAPIVRGWRCPAQRR